MKTNYYGESPCIPFIWKMLDNLDKKQLLIRKLQPAVRMPLKDKSTKKI